MRTYAWLAFVAVLLLATGVQAQHSDGAPLETLAAATPLKGLNAGTRYGDHDVALDDVAVDGVAVTPWNSTSYHYAAGSTYDFVLFFASTVVATDIPWQMLVVSQDTSTLLIRPTTPTNGTLTWTDGTPDIQVFLAEFVCIREGTAQVLAQLVAASYAPVHMLATYTCSAPLFDIGTSAGASDVVWRGAAMTSGSAWDGSLVAADRSSVDLFVMLDAAGDVDTNPFYLEFPMVNSSEISVTVHNRLNNTASKDAARSAANPVTIMFECIPSAAHRNIPVVVTFYWGWSNAQTVTFVKECAPTRSRKTHSRRSRQSSQIDSL